jgi:hypothetical protein
MISLPPDRLESDVRRQRKLPPALAGVEKLGARGFTSFHGAKRR